MKHDVDELDVREIARVAACDARTVRRELTEPGAVRGAVGARIRRALASLSPRANATAEPTLVFRDAVPEPEVSTGDTPDEGPTKDVGGVRQVVGVEHRTDRPCDCAASLRTRHDRHPGGGTRVPLRQPEPSPHGPSPSPVSSQRK
jgi:hypothetical protein